MVVFILRYVVLAALISIVVYSFLSMGKRGRNLPNGICVTVVNMSCMAISADVLLLHAH